jgi:hypothetical protein
MGDGVHPVRCIVCRKTNESMFSGHVLEGTEFVN